MKEKGSGVRERTAGYFTEEKLVKLIEKTLPSLLIKRPELKLKLRSLFDDVATKNDVVAVLEELKKLREDTNKRFEEMREDTNRRFEEMREDTNRRFEEVHLEMKALREDMNRRLEEVYLEMKALREDTNKRFEEMREDTNRRFEEVHLEMKALREDFHNAITSVGSRWGEDAERAFRKGMNEILTKYFNATAKEHFIHDSEGIIKGYPDTYQVDLLITDSVHIIIEVKSSSDELDVSKLHKLGEIYEKQTGIKPRLILLTPYAREEAWREAKKLADVEIITSPRYFKP